MSANRVIGRPVILFAFTRPDYLRRLCLSLKAQQGLTLPDSQVHLMQDGAISPRSAVQYGDPERIAESIATFREVFPGGHVHASPHNLGVAMNIHRGERHAFATLKADIGYFFEEDLELGPCYLAMLEALAGLAGRNPKLGYFAAYGDHNRESDTTAPRIVPMEHHWGFGLTRRCWVAMQSWLKPFHDVYNQVDYKARPHLRIVELYEAKGVSSMASSQDVAKTMACAELGFARINTDVAYARYIGAQGESFRPEHFEKLGFGEARVASAMPTTLPDVSPAVLDRIIEEKHAACAAHRRERYETELSEMRRRLFNPDRPATREEVGWLWRLLMDRVPAEGSYGDPAKDQRTLRQLRRALLRSREAQGKGFYLDPPAAEAPLVSPAVTAPAAAPAVAPAKPRPPPKLGAPHMSAPELALFEKVLGSGRRRYAEFGIGGSTLLASRQGFEAMVGVDSDPSWASSLRAHAEIAPAIAAGRASILHADIGPVGPWGRPVDAGAMARWPRYVGAMWSEWSRRESFPDLLFVDGRFRVACCLSVALMHAARGRADPLLVLMHDISDARPHYRAVFDAFRLVSQADTLVAMEPREDADPAALMAVFMARMLDPG